MNHSPVEINAKPPIGQLGVDAALLAKRLAKAEFGELVTYSELSGMIGRNIQGDARHVLSSARRVVLRENEIAFDVVENEGLRRMTDDELAESYHPALSKIRRTARKAARVVACADMGKLSPDKQRAVSAGLSAVGAIELFTSAKNVRKIEDSVKPSAIPQKVNVEELSRLFAR